MSVIKTIGYITIGGLAGYGGYELGKKAGFKMPKVLKDKLPSKKNQMARTPEGDYFSRRGEGTSERRSVYRHNF